MLEFSRWIAATSLSALIDNALWVIPTVQTIHIICLALLFSSVGAVALASYGRLGKTVSLAQMGARFAPWIWGSLLILLITGTILIIGEPERELINWAFWIKIPLLVVTAAATALFMSSLGRSDTVGDVAFQARARTQINVLVGLWALVVIFGRLIAYAQISAS